VNVTIFGLRPRALVYLYRRRLRTHRLQEMFAAAGIAVGVALVFAVQVANTSVTGSAREVVENLTGNATLQLAARSADGFDERLGVRAARLPGVRRAAPLLRVRVDLVGRGGRRAVELVGATPALAGLGGEMTQNFGEQGLQIAGGIGLTSTVADEIGATPRQPVTLMARGETRRGAVGAVLESDTIGPLAGSRAAMTSLLRAQQLTGMRQKLSQLLIEPRPGAEGLVRQQLERLAAGRLSVLPADNEVRALSRAAEPNDQSTGLFAGIAAMVGLLFALNAMLFTSAERRRFIADLRTQGFERRQVLLLLVFEALVLGVVGSLAGLALGDVLSRLVFDEVPQYLVFAFPVGTERVVHASTVALAFGVGVLAALVASLRPMLDLRSRLPVDGVFRELGEPGEQLAPRLANGLFLSGVALIAATTILVLLLPPVTLAGGVTLALAALLVMPAVFSWAARQVHRLSRRTHRCNMLTLAMRELRGTTTRSVALAAVGALAVYGSVAIEGAHSDLVRGLDSHTVERLSTTDLWVTNGRNDLTTDSFRPTARTAAIERAPGIAGVRVYHSALLDVGDRRVWVIGRPPRDREVIPPSQLIDGDHTQASRMLRGSGWLAISDALGRSLGVKVGDTFRLPTPGGMVPFRVAATTTNLGWPPGAIILNRSDFARAWGANDPSALEVDLEPGVAPLEGKRVVEQTLGARSGLRVQTLDEREAQYFALGRQGLTRLTEISTLLLIAAALAVACALAATIWQRRRRLASLKIQGFDHWQLWRSLLLEAGFVIAVGCAVGTALGVYGHVLAGRYLKLTTGFPASFSLGAEQMLVALGLVAGVAYAVVAVPGYAAAKTPPRASFQE
jgi:putative ABC transport system permease protein